MIIFPWRFAEAGSGERRQGQQDGNFGQLLACAEDIAGLALQFLPCDASEPEGWQWRQDQQGQGRRGPGDKDHKNCDQHSKTRCLPAGSANKPGQAVRSRRGQGGHEGRHGGTAQGAGNEEGRQQRACIGQQGQDLPPDQDGKRQCQHAVAADPAVTHDFEPALRGRPAPEPVSAVGKTVFMQCAGRYDLGAERQCCYQWDGQTEPKQCESDDAGQQANNQPRHGPGPRGSGPGNPACRNRQSRQQHAGGGNIGKRSHLGPFVGSANR